MNHLHKKRSDEFIIPPKKHDNELHIVVACHSHAPLQEIWDRVPGPKLGIVMPCCGKTWSHLSDTPIFSYDDFEVYSPKRRILLYYSDLPP